MPLDLALDTAMQMAEALAFAHEHGVIHRDIKPANVVVTGRRGRIKLTDFGIAHLINSDHTQAGQMLGSPRYMSPEQAKGCEINGRSDIFSLGAMLYEMLTGRYAFDGDSLPTIVYRVINEAPVPATTLRPRLPAELINLLARMLNKNPQARPDARALVDAFQALAPAVPPALTPLPSNRVSRLLRVLAFGMPVVVFLLIGVGMIVIEHFLDTSRQTVATATPPSTATRQDADSQQTRDTISDGSPASEQEAGHSESPIASDAYLAGLDQKRVELRIKRTELLLQYTKQHPDVVQVDRQLDLLRIERRRYLQQLQKQKS
jgi:serine/threonine-protein kinase